jgi:hypothetical protein
MLVLRLSLSSTSRPNSASISKAEIRSTSLRRTCSASRVGWLHLRNQTWPLACLQVRKSPHLRSELQSRSLWHIPKPRNRGFATGRLDSNESNRETGPKDWIRAFAKGSRRPAASKGDALAHASGVFIYGAEIVRLEFRVVFQDLVLGYTCSEPIEDIPNGNTKSSNAGLPGSLTRFNRDTRTRDRRIPPQLAV